MNIITLLKSKASIIISVFLFFLVFFPGVSTVCMFLLIMTSFIERNQKQNLRSIFRQKSFLLLAAFFTLHVLSILYSSNLNYALFDFVEKLPFLLMPVAFASFSFTTRDYQQFKTIFIYSVSVAGGLCISMAVYNYTINHETGSFFYTGLSQFQHPAYFSMYLNLALLFLIDDFFTGDNKKSQLLNVLLTFFFLALITMLSSRTAWSVTILTILSYFCITIFRRKIKLLEIIFVISLIAWLSLSQFLTMHLFDRYSGVSKAVELATATPVDTVHTGENSAGAHIHLWKNAAELIKNNLLLGVGIGDVKDELMIVYQKNNYLNGIENKLNPHNQYLQTGVALGMTGIILLLWILLNALWTAYKNRNWVCLLFILIIALNSLTESVLERRTGILFFAFFYVFFLHAGIKQSKKENIPSHK